MSRNNSEFKVAIIGGGISGIAQAVTLKRQLGNGVNIKIFEKRSSLGGVWRDAKWPGAGVDVPIHLYSLFSDLKSDWTTLFAEQPEVLAYWESLVDKHDLRRDVILDTEYVGSEWISSEQHHAISFRRSDGSTFEYSANVIISANGPLSKPTIPKLPGLENFEGVYFHNLHWDESVDLSNKRVAVIGNGSSGIQLVVSAKSDRWAALQLTEIIEQPGVADIPGVQLTHFIRSGGYFVPKVNTPYSAATKFLFKYVPLAQRAYRFSLFLESNDRWRAKKEPKSHPTPMETQLLDHLTKTAPPEYLDALTPKYPLGCKRVAFDVGWLESLHRPNVDLVNHPIVQVTPRGLVTSDGVEKEFDVIIFATGSNVAEHGVGLNVGLKGETGQDLQSHWKQIGGPKAYMGTAVPEFPNYFIILGPNAIAGSWGYTIGCKALFNAKLLQAMIRHHITSLQPRSDAFEKHNEELQRGLAGTSMKSKACDNWWRVGGNGLLSVPNSVSGFRLAELTRKIIWDDWLATRIDTDSGKPVEVIVKEGSLQRRSLALGFIAVSLAAATLSRSSGSSNFLPLDQANRLLSATGLWN